MSVWDKKYSQSVKTCWKRKRDIEVIEWEGIPLALWVKILSMPSQDLQQNRFIKLNIYIYSMITTELNRCINFAEWSRREDDQRLTEEWYRKTNNQGRDDQCCSYENRVNTSLGVVWRHQLFKTQCNRSHG